MASNTHERPLFDRLLAFLAAHDLQYRPLGDTSAVEVDGEGSTGPWRLVLSSVERRRRYDVISIHPELVPLSHMAVAQALVEETNRHLELEDAVFLLDEDQRQVSVLTWGEIGDGEPTFEVISNLVGLNIGLMDDAYDAIGSIGMIEEILEAS